MLNQPTIDTFLKMVDSLRRHQRAELLDENSENIIEKLYTDPVEGDFVLKTMLLPQTTILVGRKGTGKSTIISRFQHEIRKTDNNLSLYVDVRTIYDQSLGTPEINQQHDGLTEEEYHRYSLYKIFIKTVLNEIRNEINKNVFVPKILKIFKKNGITESEFRKNIDAIFEEINTPKFEDITAVKNILKRDIDGIKTINKESSTKNIKLTPGLEFEQDKMTTKFGEIGSSYEKTNNEEQISISNDEYSTILIRYLNIFDFINKIKSILKEIGIKQVFICLDDASELEKSALDIFMRTLIAPINNSADGYFRFKITFYPGRDHLPNLDRTKLEILNLDYYNLYQSYGIDKVEENAISYTRRLLNIRFKYFFGDAVNLEDFFDTKSNNLDDYYKQLFQASSNVPRIVGKILWYAAKRSISQGNKISKRVLQDASKEHYILEIEPILIRNEYIQYRNYGEIFEKEHLKKLIELIIVRAKENKRQIGNSNSDIFNEYSTDNAPSNYLYFPPDYEDYLKTLELNFFISKYAQQKDKGSGSGKNYIPPKEVSIYTLNYGLCQKENIKADEGSNRKYRTERVFDFSNLILDWINSTQIVRCTYCNTNHPVSKWEAIKSLDSYCTVCHKNTCVLESVKYELSINTNTDLSISEKDFQVLEVLHIEEGLTTPQIAMELDRSYQSINQSVRYDRFMLQKGLIEKFVESGKNKYKISNKATEIYFI